MRMLLAIALANFLVSMLGEFNMFSYVNMGIGTVILLAIIIFWDNK